MLGLDVIVGLGLGGTVRGRQLIAWEVLEHLGIYLGDLFRTLGEGMVVFKWGNMLGDLEHFMDNDVGNDRGRASPASVSLMLRINV